MLVQLHSVDLGSPVHYADFGGDGPPAVLVHGLGGAHVNWLALGRRLAGRFRPLAPDLPGFGLSPPAGRPRGLEGARRALERFIDAVSGGRPVLLVGNSMGGLVSLLHASKRPDQLAGLVLISPAQPLARRARVDAQVAGMFALYMIPGLGEAFLRRSARRLGPERMVRAKLRLCCADQGSVPPEVLEASLELARRRHREMPWSDAAFLTAARSILRTLVRRDAYAAMVDAVQAPTLLLQGGRDRLVPIASTRALARRRPDWTLRVYDHLGHIPMIEDAALVAASIEEWLEGRGRRAAERLRRDQLPVTGGMVM